MKFFLDSADVSEIIELNASGLVDGVTTNPSLIAKSGRKLEDVIAQICAIIKGPVSAEVLSTDYEGMIHEGKALFKIASNVCIKLPMTLDGIRACKHFSDEGIQTNVTLCFSAAQAILAAKAGATFVSPFVGRLDDIGQDGMTLIDEIREIYLNYDKLTTQILVASVRNPIHVISAAKIGAHVATIPGKVIRQLISHPLTDRGIEIFLNDSASRK